MWFLVAFQNSPRASEAQRKGLQSRHAYTITKVNENYKRSKDAVCIIHHSSAFLFSRLSRSAVLALGAASPWSG